MASVAAAISSSSLLLSMVENAFLRQVVGPADASLFRQFLQAQPNKLRGLGVLTSTARRRGDRSRRLRLTVAEIDQRGNRVSDRAWRAVIVDRAGKMHHGRIDVGEGRRLVL